ncbi:MAG: hypothetical protein JJT78_11100 [Leptospira sp.]|nr:hypothetical protein [Leptospira sp.]
MKIYVILFLLVINCGSPKGNFGWTTTMDEGISEIDREFKLQTQFQMSREDLFFSLDETIHFVYIFESRVSHKDEFFFSLNKKSIDYLEIDLRRKSIEEGNPIIRDKYRGLDIGDYRLKVAYEGDVFDEVDFKVMPDDEYFKAGSEEDLTEESTDEIIRYSKEF